MPNHFFLLLLSVSLVMSSQTVVDVATLPADTVQENTLEFNQSRGLLASVALIGKGSCSVADGRLYNGMMDNPALLIHERLEPLSIAARAMVTQTAIKTFRYVGDSDNALLQGHPYDSLKSSIRMYDTATTAEQRFAAVEKAQAVFDEVNEFTDTILGYPDPMLYGLSLLPRLSLQWKRFGFTFVSEGRAFLFAQPGALIENLSTFKIKTDSLGYVDNNAIDSLNTMISNIQQSDSPYISALFPTLFTVGFLDITTSAGYAHPIAQQFAVGVNLNFQARVFVASLLDGKNYARAMSTSLSQLFNYKSNYFLSLDLGGHYERLDKRLSVGVSLQNCIPLLKIKEQVSYYSTERTQEYHLDSAGNIMVGEYDPLTGVFVPDSTGDTLVDYTVQPTVHEIPLLLDMPFIATIGTLWLPKQWLEFSAEWRDIFAQDQRSYARYPERFYLGAQVDFRKMFFFRTGLNTLRPTIGAGIHATIAKKWLLGMDYAYSYDGFSQDMASFVEITTSLRF